MISKHYKCIMSISVNFKSRIVCAELGFGSTALKFIGSKTEYEEKFPKQVVDDDRIPDYRSELSFLKVKIFL